MPAQYYMGKKYSSSSLTENHISNIIEDNPVTAASSRVVYDLANKKMEYYIIIFDGESFKYNNNILTFNEIKEKCLDEENFVYAQYNNRLYIPQYISNNNIFFESSYPDSDVPQMHRIGINNLNQVNKYSYNLVKDTQFNSEISELKQNLVNKIDGTHGLKEISSQGDINVKSIQFYYNATYRVMQIILIEENGTRHTFGNFDEA